MSEQNTADRETRDAEATVEDLDADVPRLCNGRRKGDHGKRTSLATRGNIESHIDELLKAGEVTYRQRVRLAYLADVSIRTIDRWVREYIEARLTMTTGFPLTDLDAPQVDDGDTQHADSGDTPLSAWEKTRVHRAAKAQVDVGSLPKPLYRHLDTDSVILSPDEASFFAQHTVIRHAIDAVRADPTHRLRHFAPSTLYKAWANVAEPIRVGSRSGAKSQRANEATYPLTGRGMVNETFSIDEYDLKVACLDERGNLVWPKVLAVRERLSGTVLSHYVRPGAASGIDTGVVLAAAAIGFTTAHPRDPEATLRVSGIARYLNTDQGGPFIGEPGKTAARRLGLGINPIPTHQPQANGDHEQMHQYLLAHFMDGPGSRRGYVDRAENRADHGLPPLSWVIAETARVFDAYNHTQFTSGERAGRSRLAVYADEVEAGNVYQGHELTEADEGSQAIYVGERSWDKTRGIEFNGQYWLTADVARRARGKQRIIIRRLLDPNLMYAYDSSDTFLGVLVPRVAQDPLDVIDLHSERVFRAQFTQQAGDLRAGAAREGSAGHWDEIAASYDHMAEALADAADEAELSALAELATKARARATRALSVVPTSDPDALPDPVPAPSTAPSTVAPAEAPSPGSAENLETPAPEPGRPRDRRLDAHRRDVARTARTEADLDSIDDAIAAEYLAARKPPSTGRGTKHPRRPAGHSDGDPDGD
ncbi:hypothetical protein [Nocardioides sp.]|uniref:hypothetical protein n=1 Tax=Nocardioides sp. TaxID=35761 RepID=UPI00273534B0|nr:hypothetical protein [Nocardioides sp.]MDP3890487.1 hypothetical protein [Nocardioides sp.]